MPRLAMARALLINTYHSPLDNECLIGFRRMDVACLWPQSLLGLSMPHPKRGNRGLIAAPAFPVSALDVIRLCDLWQNGLELVLLLSGYGDSVLGA